MKKIFTLVALAALLYSCLAGSDKSQENEVKDIQGEWAIEEAMGKSTAGGDKEAVITFAADSTFAGNATVNSFFGDYRYVAEGDSLILDHVGMTRMMGGSMEIEAEVEKAINALVTVELADSVAVLFDKDKNQVMKLRRK